MTLRPETLAMIDRVEAAERECREHGIQFNAGLCFGMACSPLGPAETAALLPESGTSLGWQPSRDMFFASPPTAPNGRVCEQRGLPYRHYLMEC